MLPRNYRLSRQQDLLPVLRKGERYELSPLRLFLKDNGGTQSRFGFLLKEKVLPGAVSRNRWKRLMRNIIWTNRKKIAIGQDVIVMLASKPKHELEYVKWEPQVLTLLRSAGMLKKHV